jgi:iron(III) transport system substrate-binding protein
MLPLSHYKAIVEGLLIISLCAWRPSTAIAADQALIELAKQEGKVVFFSVAGESQQLANKFERTYPFIKVEVIRATAYPLLNRIINEAMVGKYSYDVVWQTVFPMNVLIQRKLVQTYESPERRAYRSGWKDNDGYWTYVDQLYFVIGYNTKLVQPTDVPRDWKDLLNPKWKGKIGMDPDNHLLYGGLEQQWGKSATTEYFKQLARQDVQFRNGNTLLAQLVVAGEYPLAFLYAHRVEFLKAQGASIDWVSTMNPILAIGSTIALAAKPVHSSAGKLLLDFILSRDGQGELQSINRIPSRSDVPPLSAKADPSKLYLHNIPPSAAEREAEWRETFRSIFNLGGVK